MSTTFKNRNESTQRKQTASAPRADSIRSTLRGMSYAEGAAALSPVQRRAGGGAPEASVNEIARAGVAGASSALPYLEAIQASFGGHDVSAVQCQTSGAGSEAARAIGATAYATGNRVAFDGAPTLHTAAHEAAHVVQQRAGVQLKGGVGQAGDAYECHADAVADLVVSGRSAEGLLDQMAGGGGDAAVQKNSIEGESTVESTSASTEVHKCLVAPPGAGALVFEKSINGSETVAIYEHAEFPDVWVAYYITQSGEVMREVPVDYLGMYTWSDPTLIPVAMPGPGLGSQMGSHVVYLTKIRPIGGMMPVDFWGDSGASISANTSPENTCSFEEARQHLMETKPGFAQRWIKAGPLNLSRTSPDLRAKVLLDIKDAVDSCEADGRY